MAIATTSILTAEITLEGTSAAAGGSAKNILNVFHYRRTATAVDASKTSLKTIFLASVVPAIVAGLNVRALFSSIGVRWVDDAMDAKMAFAISQAGAVAGDSHPNYVAGTIQLKTAIRSRSGIGSKHFGPLSESDGVGDVFTGAGLTRFQAIRDVLDDALVDADGNNWVPCVLSRTLSQLEINPTTVVRNDITSAILNVSFGSMRRRKVRTVN